MRISVIALAAAGTLAFAATATAADCPKGAKVLKFAHVVAAKGNPKGEAAQAFADRVNKEMAGKVCVQVFPNSTLYDDDKAMEALVLGDLQMAAPSLSKMENYTKKFRIFDLPFLFDNIAAVDAFQQSKEGQALLKSAESKGILGMGYWHNGMKQMSAKKPLIKPEDAKGLKFRIQQSDVLLAQFKALGANPQKMAFKEVYGALQTGVVDGQENTWANIWTQKFYEVQDGITETDHGVIDYIVVASAEFMNKLPKDQRAQLEKILAEVTKAANDNSEKLQQASKKKVMDAGTKVRTLNAEQRAAWKKAMKPVWDQFEGQIGKDLIAAAQKGS
ncbi:MAG: TRAP transporter substrate-binding protein [Beijerinckiaceae bacterium]